MQRNIFGSALIAALGLLLAAAPGRTQTRQLRVQYGLTPAMVVETFKPGQPFEIELAVSNGGGAPVVMRGVTMDLWYDEKSDKVFAPPGTLPRSASNWIEFVPRVITVPAQASAKVKMIVTPPANADGSYYSVAFVESKPELTRNATAESKAVFTNIRLGALILLSAEKTEAYKLAVSDVRFVAPGPNQELSLEFLADNLSNTHVFPRTQIAIVDSGHDLVGKAEGEIKRFLPGQRTRLKVSWSGDLAPGNYTAILTVIYGNNRVYTQEFPFQPGAAAQVAGTRPTKTSGGGAASDGEARQTATAN